MLPLSRRRRPLRHRSVERTPLATTSDVIRAGTDVTPPPPIVDSAGEPRWIVDYITDHEHPPRVSGRGHPSVEAPALLQPRDDTEWVGSGSRLKRTRGCHVSSSFGTPPMSCKTMSRSLPKPTSPWHSPQRLEVQTTATANGNLRGKHAAGFAVMIKSSN
ncbi:hypothetical protein PR003_g12033 [Phytophthora rubi]|uniref:Uncharacterized protein n=1 Tax=Phytophthora rubi TaxID=129364 RepID=A0A6A3MWL6_9STRA|nr:hypothetical protein PR001_g8327 [Phytophthora rubi]KAE9337385.1 hypothetical protein PR003_g12033 [Phytophthora rubi]